MITMAVAIPKRGNITKAQQTGKRTPAKKAPGKALTIVKPKAVDTGDFTETTAKKLTEQIRKSNDGLVELIIKAYQGRIWLTLGHKTWNDYIDSEFPDGKPLLLPKGTRPVVVKALRVGAQMSSRAIAAATGVSHQTAARDIADQGGPFGPPDGDTESGSPQPPLDAEFTDLPDEPSAEAPPELDTPDDTPQATVTGQDGKVYPATQPRQEKAVDPVADVKKFVTKGSSVVKEFDAIWDREDVRSSVEAKELLVEFVSDILDMARVTGLMQEATA
jgi:hypothetical protein